MISIIPISESKIKQYWIIHDENKIKYLRHRHNRPCLIVVIALWATTVGTKKYDILHMRQCFYCVWTLKYIDRNARKIQLPILPLDLKRKIQ